MFTTLKHNLQPNTVTILQSPIAQRLFRENLPRGPREQAVSRVWLGDSWSLPSTHSAQLQGPRSGACLHLCQLKIGLSGDQRHMHKGWLKKFTSSFCSLWWVDDVYQLIDVFYISGLQGPPGIKGDRGIQGKVFLTPESLLWMNITWLYGWFYGRSCPQLRCKLVGMSLELKK